MKNKELINKFITIEKKISNLYYNLYNLEVKNEKGECMYSHYINSLKDALKNEETFIKGLSIEQINGLIVYINNNSASLEFNLGNIKFAQGVMFRTLERLKFTLCNRQLNSNHNVLCVRDALYEERKEKFEISNIIMKENVDYSLSFYDEYIDESNDSLLVEKLIYGKYYYAYTSLSFIEQQIIEREFKTEKCLYINSSAIAETKKIDMNRYYEIRNSYACSLTEQYIVKFYKEYESLSSLNQDRIGVVVKAYHFNTIAAFRAAALLMDNNVFADFINKMKSYEDFCVKIKKVLDIDIIDTLNKDRERHKYLSLKRK